MLGFLIEYHREGSLRDILAVRRLQGTLALDDQLKWASQVVEALQHIKSKGPGWYCDLRLDNILLSDKGDVVMIDFEQRGVLPDFASPMDNYLQYVNALVNDPLLLDPATKKEYRDLYEVHIGPFVPKRRDQHHGCVPWLCMSKSERDASEMYMLGRLFWCIFESVSSPQKELWMEYLYEPEYEFPEFRHTPKPLRQLILSCVPDWIMVDKRIQRKDYQLSVRVSSKGGNQGRNAFEDMIDVWQRELDRAKGFLRTRGEKSVRTKDENPQDGRLTLDDVLMKLQESVLHGGP